MSACGAAFDHTKLYHVDGQPRSWLLRSVRQTFHRLGWRWRSTAGSKRIERRARTLDALEVNQPAEYRRRMRLIADRARALDAAYNAKQRARDCGVSSRADDDARRGMDELRGLFHQFRAMERSKGMRAQARDQVDRDAALQAGYDERREAGGNVYRNARAIDRVPDPIEAIEAQWGISPSKLPVALGTRGGRATDGRPLSDLEAAEIAASVDAGCWIGR